MAMENWMLLTSPFILDAQPQQQAQQEEIQDEEAMFFPELEDDFVPDVVVAAVAQEEATNRHITVDGDEEVSASHLQEKKPRNVQLQQQQEDPEKWEKTIDTLNTFASPSLSSLHQQLKANPATTADMTTKKPQKKKRKRPGCNNDGLPKRPLSAYNLFFQAKRAEMLSHHVVEKTAKTKPKGDCRDSTTTSATAPAPTTFDMPPQHVHVPPQMLGKVIGQQWRELRTSERKFYQDLADRESERYRREMEAIQDRHENANNNNNNNNNNTKRSKIQAEQEEDHKHCSKNVSSATAIVDALVTPFNNPSSIPNISTTATGGSTACAAIPTNTDTRWTGMLSALGSTSSTTAPSLQSPQVAKMSISPPHDQHRYVASTAVATTATSIDSQQRQPQYQFSHYHYPPYDAAPAPYPPMAVMAMPPGMEIYLTVNNGPIPNNNSGSTTSHQGQALQNGLSGEMEIPNHHQRKQQQLYHHHQPTISESSQRQQGYRLVYQCFTLKRFQADQYVENFLNKGLQVVDNEQQQQQQLLSTFSNS